MTIIKDGNQLEKFLQELAKVSVDDAIRSQSSSAEKVYQKKMEKDINLSVPHGEDDEQKKSKEADDDSIFQGNGEEEADPKSLKSEPEVDQAADITPDDITVDAIVDKLNIIRSGKSLKDREVSAEMDEYIRGLEEAQRVALYSFLKSIGQVVAADVSGDTVKEPDEEPYDVKMKRVKGLEQKRKMKQKEKDYASQEMDRRLSKSSSAPKPAKKSRPSGKEDTAPPIRVGESLSPTERMAMKQYLVD